MRKRMFMKTNISFLALAFFMSGILITSCGEKSNQDRKNVKDDVKELNRDLQTGAKNTTEEIKAKVTADWEQFKTTSENTIQSTENEIKTLREKISKASEKQREKLSKEADRLEQKNKELKERLAVRTKNFKEGVVEFNEKAKENQKEFEREFKHDMDEMGKAIKGLFEKNTN